MRSRILPAVGVSALALVAAAAFAPMASANGHTAHAAHRAPASTLVHAKPLAGHCYAQNANDAGVGVVSQNFEAAFDIYDSQGADNFRLRKSCTVRKVVVAGQYFNGAGPANSVHVTLYKTRKGGPGKVLLNQKAATYTDASGTGNFTIKVKKTVLPKGNYWVSVQANMDFSTGGEWGWNTNLTSKGAQALWKNPGDGFASGCTSYSNMFTCLGGISGTDFTFEIN